MKVLPLALLFLVISLSPLQSENFLYFKDFQYPPEHSSSFCFDNEDLELLLRKKSSDQKNNLIKPLFYHPLIDDKEVILDCAQTARECANVHLEQAEDLLNNLKKIEDWRLKERLQVLIHSSVGTMLIPEPKLKFLSLALALLSDLIVNEGFEKSEIAYNIYLELSYATRCLEEFKYYCRLSLETELPEYSGNNNGWKYTNFAIDDLTCADMLTASLEHKLTGTIVSDHITRLRKALMNDMIKNRCLTSSYLSKMECCLDNFDELVAECPRKDRLLTDKIYFHLDRASRNLKMAEREFRKK